MRPQAVRLLDADVMIDVQRRHPAAAAWYASASSGSLALPGHVLMELYQSAQNQQQTLAADRLTRSLPLIWPTDAESLQAVANFRRLHLSHGLGLIDSLIAATALSLGVPLCTFNVKHFRHSPASLPSSLTSVSRRPAEPVAGFPVLKIKVPGPRCCGS